MRSKNLDLADLYYLFPHKEKHKFQKEKNVDLNKIGELKKDMKRAIDERASLEKIFRESQTQNATLRSKITHLETLCNEKDISLWVNFMDSTFHISNH